MKPAADSEAVEAVPAMADETMAEETTVEEVSAEDVTNAKAVAASAVKLQSLFSVIEAAYLTMTNPTSPADDILFLPILYLYTAKSTESSPLLQAFA